MSLFNVQKKSETISVAAITKLASVVAHDNVMTLYWRYLHPMAEDYVLSTPAFE